MYFYKQICDEPKVNWYGVMKDWASWIPEHETNHPVLHHTPHACVIERVCHSMNHRTAAGQRSALCDGVTALTMSL